MRSARITREIQLHDRDLFCAKDYKGRLAIFRKAYAHDDIWIDDQTVIKSLVMRPMHIMSLTHNWSPSGEQVEWGLDPIMVRLKEIDGHNRDICAELEQSARKAKESKERSLNSETEAFVKDWRKDFQKSFNDINTSTVEKTDSRRKAERRAKHGYSKS